MKTKNNSKVLLFVFAACQNDEKTENKSVEGTYIGSFTTTSMLKSATIATGNMKGDGSMMDGTSINYKKFQGSRK